MLDEIFKNMAEAHGGTVKEKKSPEQRAMELVDVIVSQLEDKEQLTIFEQSLYVECSLIKWEVKNGK